VFMFVVRSARKVQKLKFAQTIVPSQSLRTTDLRRGYSCTVGDDHIHSENINFQTHIFVPRIGEQAPAFTGAALVDGKFKTISLSDYAGKYVYLFFYPLDFTFVCPTEIIEFSDRVKEFRDLGCEVIGVSIDSQFTHLAWTKTSRKDGGLGSINIPLVADVNREISEKYGVLFGNKGFTLRGSFLISPNGTLRQVTMNEPPVGRSADEALRLVHAFKHVDTVGEVCPINWKPGKQSMKADPEKSKEYFRSSNKE